MLDQIAKDLAETVKENVESGMDALSKSFSEKLDAVKKEADESKLSFEGKIDDLQKKSDAIDTDAAMQEFADAFIKGMSDGA